MKIAIVAPAYNEEKGIEKFLRSVSGIKYPIYIIDDGSTDNTHKILSKYQIPNSKYKVLRHKVNLGKGAAMKTGAEAAFSDGHDAVVFIDTDGQHDLADLFKFVKKLKEGYDVVYGSRNMNMGVPLVRYLGNKATSVVISLLFGIYISDILCGYRAVSAGAYKKIKWDSPGYAVETEMVIRTSKEKLKHCEVPVATLYLDVFKGVSVMDAVGIFFDILRWRIRI
jgi:glycosyltransferase involved in cell wall biosynthesis